MAPTGSAERRERPPVHISPVRKLGRELALPAPAVQPRDAAERGRLGRIAIDLALADAEWSEDLVEARVGDRAVAAQRLGVQGGPCAGGEGAVGAEESGEEGPWEPVAGVGVDGVDGAGGRLVVVALMQEDVCGVDGGRGSASRELLADGLWALRIQSGFHLRENFECVVYVWRRMASYNKQDQKRDDCHRSFVCKQHYRETLQISSGQICNAEDFTEQIMQIAFSNLKNTDVGTRA
jgi:hypothetical protein